MNITYFKEHVKLACEFLVITHISRKAAKEDKNNKRLWALGAFA